jgi:hypothetical protein
VGGGSAALCGQLLRQQQAGPLLTLLLRAPRARRLVLLDYKEQLEQAYCQQQELASGAALPPDELRWASCSARCEQLVAQPPRLQALSAQALTSSIVPPDVARVGVAELLCSALAAAAPPEHGAVSAASAVARS